MTEPFDHRNCYKQPVFCNSASYWELLQAGQIYMPQCFTSKIAFTQDHRMVCIDDRISEPGLHDDPPAALAIRRWKEELIRYARQNYDHDRHLEPVAP